MIFFLLVLRPDFRSKFILQLFGVQNLFCIFLECKIYFAAFWSAKFILQLFGVQNLFCGFLECKIYFAAFWSAKFILQLFGVQNLFCFQPNWNTKK